MRLSCVLASCCQNLLTNSRPTALQGDWQSTACKSQHASHIIQMGMQHHQHCIALLSHRESDLSQHHTAVKSCLQILGPLHCRVTSKAQHAIHSMQMKLQQHQHCIALLSHKESGALQHHTAVNSCLQIPGPLHCSVTVDRAQLASHSMQQMGISSTGVKSCLPIPGSLHCSMTDKTQHASHSMQQIGISSTAASSSLYSIAVTWREWSCKFGVL